jgi:hypothetical protein
MSQERRKNKVEIETKPKWFLRCRPLTTKNRPLNLVVGKNFKRNGARSHTAKDHGREG